MDKVIGKEATASLIKNFGGISLYIGKCPSDAVVDAIGYQAALKLSQAYDGDTIYISNAKAASMALRNSQIKTERLSGRSIAELCRKYNLTNRRISAICA